jgi:opacity protein-like surface antigen
MKKLMLLGVAGLLALVAGGPAIAADIPVKAPIRAPAASYSWTGFYFGGNVGYSWGSSRAMIGRCLILFSRRGRSIVPLLRASVCVPELIRASSRA